MYMMHIHTDQHYQFNDIDLNTFIHTYILTYRKAFVNGVMLPIHTYINTYIVHIYIHTYIVHTYIHTYIHT